MFGQPISLNFNHDDNYQTVFGGVLSIVIIILVLLTFWNSIIDFFNKDTVTVSQNIIYSTDPNGVFL